MNFRPGCKEQMQKPNILLILADDMGYADVSSAGNPYRHTPTLDALAQNGVRFSNFYPSPVFAPTRTSLLTGRYPQRTGVQSLTNGHEMMVQQENDVPTQVIYKTLNTIILI